MENKKNKGKIIVIAVVMSLLIITNLLTFLVTASCNMAIGNKVLINTPSSKSAKNITKLIALEELIQEDYYKELDEQDLWDYAFKGLAKGTGDLYTNYYTEEEFEEYTSELDSEFYGIGVQIMNNEDGAVLVDSVFQGSPAEEAGMKAGDIIIKIDDFDSSNVSVSEASNKLRGKKGTKVDVVVLRNNKEVKMTITRDKVKATYVSGKMIDNMGYIRISEFSSDVAKDFRTYYDKFTSENMKGLIIDLRDNPGGLVNEATDIANILLKKDMTIISTTNKSGETQTEKDTTDEYAKVPVVVLVNGNSASASEILSCSLQDNEMATIIGEKSYGKGIIQEVKPLNDGSGITVTIDEYLSPKGHQIHKKGITPYVTVKANSDKAISKLTLDEDNQLQKALSYLKQQIK
ncbi:S41 family peptidase [Anaerofustis stercorihominis]|uniref:S41 family peptidase n=1 Tax=Anaerofustis stercorihominis TaxID=214853 RepID=UPI001106EC71|nr:S41 family peptidase [Anaerofustis stercorihominis]